MTFLEKFEALKKSIPVPAVVVTNNENCQFVDYTHHSKNCSYCFHSHYLENGIYCDACAGKNLVDCNWCAFCELCYQSINSFSCYHSTYLLNCTDCRDCHFCSICVSCSDCFGCVALSHKQYCIFNKQYTKTRYQRKLAELEKEKPEKHLQKLYGLIQKIPYPQSFQRNNINCPYGDYLNNSKDVYWAFDTISLEDSGYIFFGGLAKHCWDMTFGGGGTSAKASSIDETIGQGSYTELCYELCGAGSCYHSAFLEQCSNCTNCYHSAYLRNCSDCFGCVGLTNKKYCILNNQLTKEQYEQAIKIIKKELGWK